MATNDTPTRRAIILANSAVGAVLLAGCIEDTADGPASRDDRDGDVNDTTPSRPDADTNMTFTIKQLGATGSAGDGTEGALTLHETPAGIQVASDPAQQFVDETTFDTQRLLEVVLVGPNTCYDRLEFDGLTVDNGVVTGAATIVDTSAPTAVCGDAITAATALVRVDAPVSGAELVLTDGWDESTTVRTDQ